MPSKDPPAKVSHLRITPSMGHSQVLTAHKVEARHYPSSQGSRGHVCLHYGISRLQQLDQCSQAITQQLVQLLSKLKSSSLGAFISTVKVWLLRAWASSENCGKAGGH